MTYTIKINDLTTFPLSEWNTNAFDCDYTITVLTSDLLTVKEAFTDIKKIEVFQNHIPIAEYTYFDGFSSITLIPDIYVPDESTFIDGLRITLTKQDIIQQVQNIEDMLNKTVNIESMSADEYRTYLLQKVSEACQEDIYSGDFVEINGSNYEFSFTSNDQTNLKTLYDIAINNPNIRLSYHANKQPCQMYPASTIIKIYSTLQMRLLRITTYVNLLNQTILNTDSKEELLKIAYDMPLSPEYQEQMDEILAQMLTVFQNILDQFSDTNPPADLPTTQETIKK